jgi:hypothetical protein
VKVDNLDDLAKVVQILDWAVLALAAVTVLTGTTYKALLP